MLRSFFVKGPVNFDNLPENINPNGPKRVLRRPLQRMENILHRNVPIPSRQDFYPEEEDEIIDLDDDEFELNLIGNPQNSTEEEDEPEFHNIEFPIGSPDNILDVSQYEHIIYRQMRNRERKFPCCLVDLEITAEERGCLIDWLDRIHYKAQLTTNSLYKAIGIFDRALNLTVITRETMELFGLSALIIASKMEDTMPLQLDLAIKCSKRSFSKEELKKKEIQLVSLLDFDFAFPTALFFLNYYLRIAGMDQEEMLFARYVMESALTSPDFLDVRASGLAATSVVITRAVFHPDEDMWPEQLQQYTQYPLEELSPHIRNAYNILTQEDRQECVFIRLKYGSEPYYSVALRPIPDELKDL